MLNANIYLDFSLLIIALCLVAAVIVCTARAILRFFFVPTTLFGIHVYGNTMQELAIGPELLRNHLHNLGVAGISMLFALMATLIIRSLPLKLAPHEWRDKTARKAMDLTTRYWLVASALIVINEILEVTIWREDMIAKGYSGQFDWFDTLAYGIGALVIVANHYYIKPVVLARLECAHHVCGGWCP
jgi:hypothetical protein